MSLQPGEVLWIQADRDFVEKTYRQHRMAVLLVTPLLVLVLLGFFLLFDSAAGVGQLWALAGILIALVGIMAAVLVYTGKGLRERLEAIRVGVSAEGFHFVAPSAPGNAPGRLATGGPVAWQEVYFDGNRILAGRAAMQVRMPTGLGVFEREALEREILSRIPQANHVRPVSLGWRQFGKLPRAARILYGVSAAFMVATLILILIKTT